MEDNEITIPNLKNYVSIREAAGILKVSYKTVHKHVTEGRIPAVRASDVILLRIEDVKNFKPKLSGRPRTTVPLWRISPEDNLLRRTLIHVRIRQGRRATRRAPAHRKSGGPILPRPPMRPKPSRRNNS